MTKDFNSLDDILSVLKTSLQPLQKKVEHDFEKTKFPLGFIVGNPRSGTTLFLQYLASLGCFAYPSNTLARFAYAPFYGALIQQMLFNNQFDPIGELNKNEQSISFESNLGKNKGLLAPNEFQHFFRNYIPNYFPQHINTDDFNKIDFVSLESGFASIETVFNKPFITKAMMIQYNLVDFYHQLPNSIFFYIKRDPFYVMQSIYMAREKYFGDIEKWWSVKPKEYEQLKDLDIYHQIAGQVYFTEKSLETELKQIPENNKIVIYYEDFCNNPTKYLAEIQLKYLSSNYELSILNNSLFNFENTNKLSIDKIHFDKLISAYNNLKS
ncbi:MAG: sulfotransferase [Flavobacteriales bacterium]|nr:sulfotransferase [Flavobacteriales bacterium]MCL4857375.1 sulfotransferase [Flavobacteriales bacterium]